MLGGLVIGIETLCLIVETRTLGIVPHAGEKARHSAIRWQLRMSLKSLATPKNPVALFAGSPAANSR